MSKHLHLSISSRSSCLGASKSASTLKAPLNVPATRAMSSPKMDFRVEMLTSVSRTMATARISALILSDHIAVPAKPDLCWDRTISLVRIWTSAKASTTALISASTRKGHTNVLVPTASL